MLHNRALLASLLVLAASACRSTKPDYNLPLPDGASALIPLGPRDQAPDLASQLEQREEILAALDRSLAWIQRPHAQSYFPRSGIDRDLAQRSLERLREILAGVESGAELAARVAEDFQVYKSAGWDGEGGGVLFTGYCTPIFDGSLTETGIHRFPLYALPPDLVKDTKTGETTGWRTAVGLAPSYPGRRTIEAGLLRGKGLELAWLADPVDAYIAHVNGSAFIRLADGSTVKLGYAGKNGKPYTSLGKELVADGVVPADAMSLAAIRDWGRSTSPAEVEEYLNRNDSYVFFQRIDGNPHGCLDFEVAAERSLATDKALFPPGAPVFVDVELGAAGGRYQELMFDQDRGGAIRTAGRADIYMGIGPEAEQRAGGVQAAGQLYYYLLRE